MSGYQLALWTIAGVAALFSWKSPRAIGWIVALLASHTVSVLYWRSGGPYAELVAGLCDAAVCLLIYAFAKYSWEMVVWRMFQTMLLVNIIYLAGGLGIFYRVDHIVYSSILEALNVLILLTIGGVAWRQPAGDSDGRSIPAWLGLHRLVVALRSKRARAPFWSRH